MLPSSYLTRLRAAGEMETPIVSIAYHPKAGRPAVSNRHFACGFDFRVLPLP